jgi:hypothetical protein
MTTDKAPVSRFLCALGAAAFGALVGCVNHEARGVELARSGQFEPAIAELKLDYASACSPKTLRDIVNVYVEAGDLENAVAYLELYLTKVDSSEERRVLDVLVERYKKGKHSCGQCGTCPPPLHEPTPPPPARDVCT